MTLIRTQATIVLTLLVALVACGGPEERKAKYRARAQNYIQESNFPKARVALRNVLKIDPKDAEAYYLAAQVEEKEKNWRNAFINYQRVVELVPDHHGALTMLAKYYLEARLGDKVLEVADKILATHPSDPQAEALKTAVLALDGKIVEATGQAESLVARHPTEPDPAILLATLYTQNKRLSEAESILRRAIHAYPQDLDLLNSLGAILVQAGNRAGAEEVFKGMIEIEPRMLDHRLRLARFYDQHHAVEQAEAVLREAISLEPDSEQRRLALADYLATRKGPQQAEVALLDAAQRLPHSVKIQFALGTLYERTDQEGKARDLYQLILKEYKTKPAGLDANVKLASLDLAAGKKEEAEKQLQEVLKENPRSSEALILQGKMALARKDDKEAVQSFRTVLKDQPELAEVQSLLGLAYFLSGEVSLARETFEKAATLAPRQFDARRALAALDSGAGRQKEARERLEAILKDEPSDLASLAMLLNLQVAAQDWAKAEDTVLRLRSTDGASFLAEMTEGNLYQARRQYDKAVAAFERAAATDPNAPEPLFALVKIESSQGHVAQAQARLIDILGKQPEHPYAHGLLGEVLNLQGDKAGADAHFQKATRIKPDWVTSWLNWATLKLSQKTPADAVRILNAGIAANPQSEELHMLLASTLGDIGQPDLAIKEYETVLHHNPRALLAANNLAALLTDYKGDPASLKKALALSRDFEKQVPNPFFLDTLGWVHLKMGHYDEALRVIKQAVSKAPNHPVLNYHLGITYYRVGETRQAKGYLEKALRPGKQFPGQEEAQHILSQLSG